MAFNGILTGGPTFAAAATGFGNAIILDGSTQYATLPTLADLTTSTTWTAEARIKTSATGNRLIWTFGTPGNGDSVSWLGIDSGTLYASFGTSTALRGVATVNNNQWHHIAVVVTNNAYATFYVDGVADASGSISWTPTSSMPFYLGYWSSSGARWQGLIDEVAFFTTAKYTGNFTPSSSPVISSRSGQVALYRMDETTGATTIADSNTAVPIAVTHNVVFVGDSQTRSPLASVGGGTGPSGGTVTGTSYPGVTLTTLGPSWGGINLGTDSKTASQMIADAPTQATANYATGKANVAVILAGINDIGTGTDGATTAVRVSTLCGIWRSAGYKVVVLTLPPAAYPTYPSDYLAKRNAANALTRQNWLTFADALADIGNDELIGQDGQQTDTTYYSASDQTHWLDPALARVASYVAGALRVVVGLLEGGVYPVVTDVRSGSPSYGPIGAERAGTAVFGLTGTQATQLSTIATTITNGVTLASNGLDAIPLTAPSGSPTTFRESMVMLYRRFFNKTTLTSSQLKTYADNGTTVITTQTVADDGMTQTQGAA